MENTEKTMNGLEGLMDKLEWFLNGLPRPLLEPLWYPGFPDDPVRADDFLVKLVQCLKEMAEMIVEALQDEGFFDENPLIRVHPKYGDASGIVVFYKGRKVLEKWISPQDLEWRGRQSVQRDVGEWYGQMYDNIREEMDPDEFEYYFGPPWERMQ